MPDITLAKGLIASAKTLCSTNGHGKPRQTDLRRAVSTAYYAVFHALARACADALVGKTKVKRPNKAWVEVYRGLGHGAARNACSAATNIGFPQEIKEFSNAFERLQSARHAADYDPMIRLNKVETLGFITLAEDSINALNSVRHNDKIAFATWVLITSKGAIEARKRARAGNQQQV